MYTYNPARVIFNEIYQKLNIYYLKSSLESCDGGASATTTGSTIAIGAHAFEFEASCDSTPQAGIAAAYFLKTLTKENVEQ
jgi:hypothetical protein